LKLNDKNLEQGVATPGMALAAEAKKQIVTKNQTHKSDTGSPEVQIALLSTRIAQLTEHFKSHKKDHSSRRGLLTLVAKRRRLLTYLKSTSPERYKAVLAKLSIRH
jgi:small subunit ribosomal protein S15